MEIAQGITVVICCYNSEEIIGYTLQHLSKQALDQDFQLEIILVDNASTDQTAEVAQRHWQTLVSARAENLSFMIISEPRPGLSYARFSGAAKATYHYIIFCDDDNFLAPDYCRIAYQIMQTDPKIGACGGVGTPVFTEAVPQWFQELGLTYAWGPQYPEDGYVPSYSLYGAGLVIRRSIMLRLIEAGYQPVLEDRSGKQLSSGGDEELTMWCKIFGYQIYYTSRLQFQHFIKSGRLTKDYVFRLYKSIGISLAKQIPLQVILLDQEKTLRASWEFQVIKWIILGIKNSLIARTILLKKLDFQTNFWRIKTLCAERKDYEQKLNYLVGFKKQVSLVAS